MDLLANEADVEARLRRELTEDESSHVNDILEEASALVTEHCRGRVFEEIPDAVRIVTSRVAARALSAPAGSGGVASVTNQAGPQFLQTHQFTADASNGGVYLTAVDRKQLRRWSRACVRSFDTR
ncbi:head-tail adaptor Ad1 [Mycobacterium phage TChen]|uniref:Head-to-tail adaptor n=1 Tax=Mycobacterium phage TChen TaxID=2163598 RepID=A0A2S1PCW7_9CAUD|nr:head-tail adaptor Ad1 [Mycobacterium phage TChen]AWH14409.1 hypothetical protein SEA_TCHEN_8 [Mycobacterium phage TChen]